MKTFIKVIAFSTLFTVAGVQAQDYCQGASQCLKTNLSSQVQTTSSNSVVAHYCQGASECLETNTRSQIQTNSEQAIAKYNSSYCSGAAQCEELTRRG